MTDLEFVTDRTALINFISESNRIEGIVGRPPSPMEIHAHEHFLERRTLTVKDFETFVGLICTGKLRDRAGRDVHVGGHYRPPPGGPLIRAQLDLLLAMTNHTGDKEWPGAVATPWEAHCRYESLHPFTDGNGRSGRALWVWQMLRLERDPFIRPFLHTWYYTTLDASRAR